MKSKNDSKERYGERILRLFCATLQSPSFSWSFSIPFTNKQIKEVKRHEQESFFVVNHPNASDNKRRMCDRMGRTTAHRSLDVVKDFIVDWFAVYRHCWIEFALFGVVFGIWGLLYISYIAPVPFGGILMLSLLLGLAGLAAMVDNARNQ